MPTPARPELTPLLDCATVAGLLGVSARQVQQLAAERQIECVRVGRLLRFHPQAVQDFVARNTQGASPCRRCSSCSATRTSA